MMFVQRENGVIIGAYSQYQEGYAEEELPNDSSEALAYLSPFIKSDPIIGKGLGFTDEQISDIVRG